MAIYNPKSLHAEEFINDAEIRETLEYAEQNKNNMELINQILEKARPIPTAGGCRCNGLTHREASVLLACEDPEVTKRIYEIAEEVVSRCLPHQCFYGTHTSICKTHVIRPLRCIRKGSDIRFL